MQQTNLLHWLANFDNCQLLKIAIESWQADPLKIDDAGQNCLEIVIDKEYLALNGNYEIVEVVKVSTKKMFGMKGMEDVEVVKYKKKLIGITVDVTMEIFKERFQSIVEVRDEKLNKLLDGLL